MRTLNSRRRGFFKLAALVVLTAVLGHNAAADPVGYLSVTSTPPARLTVDDLDTKRSTPVENFPLAPGDHKLTLVSNDGTLKRTIGFKITAGQTTRLKVNL